MLPIIKQREKAIWCLTKSLKFYQDSRSVGAIAGFAVAIIFTWRLLRSSNGHQRRQPKRQMPAPSSSTSSVGLNSNAQLVTSGVCSSSEDVRAHNVVDDFFQPVKVSSNYCLYLVLVFQFYSIQMTHF